ncbi:VanZ family protein [Variovorax sp. 38R]|uniref:VanZ family protein n=1 Tax=Variovorax sp. 38R TaxID=2774875 RepID=UPI001CE111BC|nr:VanZ family protein [Variovorax sp. 38R]
MKSKIALLSVWAFWACVCAILVLSLAPPSTPMPSTGWDKSNHVLAFATLAFLAHKAWPGRLWLWLPSLLAYGALIETLQSFTPDRYAEWSDLWADGLGLLVGEIFARLTWWLAQRQIGR